MVRGKAADGHNSQEWGSGLSTGNLNALVLGSHDLVLPGQILGCQLACSSLEAISPNLPRLTGKPDTTQPWQLGCLQKANGLLLARSINFRGICGNFCALYFCSFSFQIFAFYKRKTVIQVSNYC